MKNTEIMPDALVNFVSTLSNHISRVHLTWRMCLELYGTDQGRVDLLNEVASAFAGEIQRLLEDDVYLGLAKLTDPAISPGKGTKRNLSLDGLLMEGEGHVSDELLTALKKASDDARAKCDSIRKHRNERIAHADLNASLRATFMRVSRDDVEIGLRAVRDCFNIFHRHLKGSSISFETLSALGGGMRFSKGCVSRSGSGSSGISLSIVKSLQMHSQWKLSTCTISSAGVIYLAKGIMTW